MEIYDGEVYQGCLMPVTKIFTQSAVLACESVKINQTVCETLQLEGCQAIETIVVKGVHAEVYYIGFDKFIENAQTEWNNEKQCFEFVYNPPEEKFEEVEECKSVKHQYGL